MLKKQEKIFVGQLKTNNNDMERIKCWKMLELVLET